MPDYSIPTSETAGSMSLQQLLPGIDLSQYDMSEFQDVIPEFSTALLEMTQAAGAQNISQSISGSQNQLMQSPTMSQVTGAGGFAGGGGGGTGLIGSEQAQRGMFSNVYSAMLGAEESEMRQLDKLKGEAGQFFSNIMGDLEKKTTPGLSYNDITQNNINLYGDNPGAKESGLYGPQGSPGFEGESSGVMQKGPDGQTYKWDGSTWSLHNIGAYSGQGTEGYSGFDSDSFGGGSTGQTGSGFEDPMATRTGP